MKLIHTADVHLDARMEAIYPIELAKERRKELRKEWWRLVEYAGRNGVSAILIAGDLFDTKKPLQTTLTVLRESIERNPDISFYYLRGNHDELLLTDMPKNFHTFTDEWSSYALAPGLRLYGCENLSARSYDTLITNEEELNIVMLHGTVAESGYASDTVNLRRLRRKGIDYLALGHIHKPAEDALDERGRYAYPGCLVGRGFDECGEKGFRLLTVENGSIDSRFIPFASRTVHERTVDLETPDSEGEAFATLERELVDIKESDIVRVLMPKGSRLSKEAVARYLNTRFYFGEAKKAAFSVAGEADLYLGDISLRGEFVRLVRESALSESEKEDVLAYGLSALRGEEAEL